MAGRMLNGRLGVHGAHPCQGTSLFHDYFGLYGTKNISRESWLLRGRGESGSLVGWLGWNLKASPVFSVRGRGLIRGGVLPRGVCQLRGVWVDHTKMTNLMMGMKSIGGHFFTFSKNLPKIAHPPYFAEFWIA